MTRASKLLLCATLWMKRKVAEPLRTTQHPDITARQHSIAMPLHCLRRSLKSQLSRLERAWTETPYSQWVRMTSGAMMKTWSLEVVMTSEKD